MQVSSRCRIRDTIGDTDISQVEKILFYIAGADPGIDLWVDDVYVDVWHRDDSWMQGK